MEEQLAKKQRGRSRETMLDVAVDSSVSRWESPPRPHLKNHRTVSEKRVHVSAYDHVTRVYGIRLFAFFPLLFILLVHRKLRTPKPDDSVVVAWNLSIMHVHAITYNFMNRPQLQYIGIRAIMNFELVHILMIV